MTGEKRMFSYEKNQDPQRAITFGDGNQGLVKGLGKIAISPDHSISNVFLVDSLDYNLLFVSQLCKMGYNCLFTDTGVTIFRRSDDSVAFKGVLEGQLYLVDFNRAELDTCLIAKTKMGWLWHHRLAHVGMKNLHKLLKGEHILGLTNCRRFDPGGSLAQMGWRETETQGGKTVRGTAASCCPAPRADALAVGGYKRSRGREREGGVRLGVSPFSRVATLSYEGPGPSFYRRKERVQVYNGGVAVC
jgi:hypothetical protein